MRSPAFSFYVRDWLCSNTVSKLHSKSYSKDPIKHPSRCLNAYMFLLCQAWLQDPMGTLPNDDDQLAELARVTLDEWLLIKPLLMPAFQTDGNGRLYNERLMIEVRKQQERSKAGSKGGSKTQAKYQASRQATLANANANGTPVVEGGVGGNQFVDVASKDSPERPSLELVLFEAGRIGLAPWKATDWFNEMEGCGWLDHLKRPVEKWRNMMARVKVKWEADGRPNGPPAAKSSKADHYETKSKIGIIRDRMLSIEDQIPTESLKAGHPELVAELKALMEQKKALEQSMFHQ